MNEIANILDYIILLFSTTFDFISSNIGTFWMLFALTFAVKNMQGITDALKGGNGVWQTKEVAVLVLLGLTVWVFVKDGNRGHEWRHFSDIEVILLIFALLTLAGLSNVIENFITFVKGRKKDGPN